ncbi:MAG: TIGR03013 family PEP-CTERM/XrtA system glycosyltransferase [Thiotrichales bacterium]|nr:TIGR03013 family PEP-CTERM/XrtA system glycosyltransferase [Thiotrichales bacterium]
MFRIFGHYIPKTLFLLGSTENLILLFSVYFSISIGASVSIMDTPIWPKALLFSVVMLLVMTAMGLYQHISEDDTALVFTRILLSFFLGVVLLTFIYKLIPDLFFGRNVFLLAVLSSFFGIITCRLVWQLRQDDLLSQNTLVLGAGKKAEQLERLNRMGNEGVHIIGYLDIEGSGPRVINNDRVFEVDPELSNLCQVIADNNIREIVIALDERRNSIPIERVLDCKMRGVRVIDVNSFLERQLGKICLKTLHPSSLIFTEGFMQGEFRSFIKRVFDITVSLTILTLTMPIMLLTALAILVESGGRGSIIYSQERIGTNNRRFKIYKFRSMQENAEVDGKPVWASKNDSRVTTVGKIIRKTRIDELPQLINVLKGDMSFVGPRPERPEFVENLTQEIPFYSLRHHVKPGITGWAQICYPYGANVNDAREKLQYDLYYLKNNTIFLDLLILIQTAAVILLCKGAR